MPDINKNQLLDRILHSGDFTALEKWYLEELVKAPPMSLNDYVFNDPTCPMHIAATVDQYIDFAPTVGGWISCSERMPDNTVPCLVYYREYDVFDGKYRDPDVMILSYIPDAKIWNIKSPVKVSHWMPLPEPPGGDKNGR